MALKWLLHQDAVSSVIIGAKKMQQLTDNIVAGDDSWQLTDEHVGLPFVTHLCTEGQE